MDPLFSLFSVGMSCLGQACCWYTVFKWCGCMESEREVIQTQAPPIVVYQASNNPFLNPNAPKDAHLRPAYG